MTNDEMIIYGALFGCVIFIVVVLYIKTIKHKTSNQISKTNPIYDDSKGILKKKEIFSDDHDLYYTDENNYEDYMDCKGNSKKTNEHEKNIYSEIPIVNINISEYQNRMKVVNDFYILVSNFFNKCRWRLWSSQPWPSHFSTSRKHHPEKCFETKRLKCCISWWLWCAPRKYL